jgi:hypothetical protein
MPPYLRSTRNRTQWATETEIADGKGAARRGARIASLPSQAEAEALARSLDGRFGVASPRVTQ